MKTQMGQLMMVAAGWLMAASSRGSIYADAVAEYQPGIGFATEFGTGLGYTNASSVLGAPSREGQFGPITPFNPPFSRGELLSLGVGGSLIVHLATPAFNTGVNPFGIDFIIHGSAGFVDIDFPNGRTDESATMFSHNLGMSRVAVSVDNVTFYALDPMLAPGVDGLYPTDGAGPFGIPVDPSLGLAAFANQDLNGIRSLYAGSAGGTGYDLAWARDALGQPVVLDRIEYVRVDVLSGRVEVDGFAVVPEPSALALTVLAGMGATGLGWLQMRRKAFLARR